MTHHHHNHRRNAMSQLVDALTALGKQIAAASTAGGVDNSAHLQAIDDHLAKLDTEEGADEATQADTTAGLQALLAAANPTPVATPAPTTAPAA
jgi:hypothetical protein